MDEAGFVIDAHCHMEMYSDPGAVLSKSNGNGILAVITSGWSLESSIASAELVKINGIFATIGVGPEHTLSESGIADLVNKLQAMAKSSKKVIGIGEIGLDAKAIDSIGIAEQEALLTAQLELAQHLGLPAVIHCRGMLERLLQILYDTGTNKAMFHFFSGNEEDAKKLEKKGYLISIPPIESSRLRRVIKTAATESLVAETDAPVVGKEPSDAVTVVKRIASLKSKSFEETGLITTQTIKDYFGIIFKEGP